MTTILTYYIISILIITIIIYRNNLKDAEKTIEWFRETIDKLEGPSEPRTIKAYLDSIETNFNTETLKMYFKCTYKSRYNGTYFMNVSSVKEIENSIKINI